MGDGDDAFEKILMDNISLILRNNRGIIGICLDARMSMAGLTYRRISMIKLLGSNNDLRTEDGVITKTGYHVAIVSVIFGLVCFLVGRTIFGKQKYDR